MRVERLNLLEQRVDETLRARVRHARNVVDRLLRIKLRTLSADLVQNVDEVRLHIKQAQLENREQADGARTDDDNVGLDEFVHVVSVVVFSRDSPDNSGNWRER